jgi:chemotaxis protein histidine kinase CheA
MQERVTQASEILGKIPGALCVLTGEPGNWHPVYVTRHFPEKFGLTMAGFAEEVAKDPFYRLEMTSITRKRLTESHIDMVSKDPYLGIFEMEMADGSKRWTDVYLLGGTDHTGKRMRMLFYVDRDEVKKAADLQIAKAEQASKMQQERARVEIREAQEKARLEVEETRTTVRKEIEEAQARTQEQIEAFRLKMNQVLNSQKESAEDMEKKLRLEYDTREQEIKRSYADKEQMLEKQMENYRRAQESELAKQQRTIDLLTADCDRELQNKQKEVDRLEEELKKTMDALRESEEIREQQRRSSELREKEQRGTVKRLQEMVESLQKGGLTAPVTGTGAPIVSAGAPAEDSFTDVKVQKAGPSAVSVNDDGWMDGMAGASDGSVIRRGAVNRQSRMPFSSGLRPETAPAAEETARRAEPIRRGFAPRQEETVRQQEKEPVQTAPARSSVMDDLVQMAASDDGVLREELFSIDDCLENVMVLQEPVCAKKRIKLELKKSVSMPDQAIGDKAKLQRALVSLLESAIEQTPGGGVINLGCRADRASGNRAYMYFTIRDSGSSIASDLMQGMFEMKDEKDDPLRAGLYIAREIVSIMGGNVRVRSRRGEGTEFMVTVCMKLP